jgi:hypothetical protein
MWEVMEDSPVEGCAVGTGLGAGEDFLISEGRNMLGLQVVYVGFGPVLPSATVYV